MPASSNSTLRTAADKPARIAILASGGGSNMQAILDHFATDNARVSGSVALVASNQSDAGALTRARAAQINVHVIGDVNDGDALLASLNEAGVSLLVLAGYLKLVPPIVVRAFRGRMLNVHPALLPAFGGQGMYGLRVHRAVLQAGAKLSGVTVHFVDEEFDRGAIAAQWPVPVLSDDTAQSLAERVLYVEHRLYPIVIEAVAAGHITLDAEGRVHGTLSATSAFATNVANLFLR
jgi:phosphoribosylglycinamide formyltransferase-1